MVPIEIIRSMTFDERSFFVFLSLRSVRQFHAGVERPDGKDKL